MKNEQDSKKMILISVIVSSLLIIVDYAYFGMNAAIPNESIWVLWSFVLLILSAYWVILDARVRKVGSPYTSGFLLYILWPILIPAYAYKTYGLKGVFVFFGFLGLLVSPYLAYSLMFLLAN